MELTGQLLAIGPFARLGGLTVKALRHYDELGLLVPAWTDPETGYRWYALEQARRAEAIRRLRRLEVPLEEIRALLDAPPDVARERLLAHQARLEGRAVEMRAILAELQRLIDGEEELVPTKSNIKFELKIDQVPEQRVLVVTERAHVDDLPVLIPRAIEEVHIYLQETGCAASGPPICVCPFSDDEGMLEAEIGWPVEVEVPGRGRIEAKSLPAARALVLKHTGPYEELARSYRLMSEAMERNGLVSAGPPREIYTTDPAEVADPQDYETVIVWPIGPEGALDESEDVFFERVAK